MLSKYLSIGALAAALPLAAVAQQAQTTTWVNVRAGPAAGFPLVARLGPGTPLAVQGCTAGFGWCDVMAWDGSRGWVYAGNIAFWYRSAQVPIASVGPVFGVPIVTFVIGSYWGQHYRNQPWYWNQPHWSNRPPPLPGVRPPPPPRPPHVRPPPGGSWPPPSVRPPMQSPVTLPAPLPGRPPGPSGPPNFGPPPGGSGGPGGGPRPAPR